MKAIGRKMLGLAGVTLLALLAGCGSASNNDQGMSFTLTGWYPTGSTAITGAGLTALEVPIGGNIVNGSLVDIEPSSFAGSVPAMVGLQNNLVGQGIRVQRAFLSFFIHGGRAQPPSTSFGLGTVLGPAIQSAQPNAQPQTNRPPTSLPPNFTGAGNSAVVTIDTVPPAIRQWIIFNKDLLPELPFDMDVTATVTGITTAGDRLDTNESVLVLRFVPEAIIPPGSGDDGSSTSSAGAEVDEGEVDLPAEGELLQ